MPPTRPAEERFWEKVNRTDGCWLWTAGTNNRGYGVFYPVHGKHAAQPWIPEAEVWEDQEPRR